jgi:hypothetical protein
VTRLIAVEPSRRRRGRARTAAGQARTQVEIVPGTAEDLPGQDSWTPRSTRPWPRCHCSRGTGAAIRQAGFKIEQEARIAVREAQLGLSVQHILGTARRD